MANLVAGRRIVAELIQNDMGPESIAAEELRLLGDETARLNMRDELAGVAALLQAERDPIETAADQIERILREESNSRDSNSIKLFSQLVAMQLALVAQQARRPAGDARIDVQKYTIAAQVNPITQVLTAKVKMEFTPSDDIGEVTLGLNQTIELHTVVDGAGVPVNAARVADSNVRLLFNTPLPKGKPDFSNV